MKFNVSGFVDSLGLMLYGMIGILIVMGVIYGLVAALTGIFSKFGKKKEIADERDS